MNGHCTYICGMENKMERIELRVTKSDKLLLQRASEILGFGSLSAFLLSEVRPKAKEVVEKSVVIELDYEDSVKVLELLDRGEVETEAMKKARELYVKLVKDGTDL
jgi:uncharacterized protein (DUF1778 family)